MPTDTFNAPERIRQFCGWFDLEPPALEFEDEADPGSLLLSDDLLAWISREGISLDWIFCGDVRGMAAAFRKQEQEIGCLRDEVLKLSPEEKRGMLLALKATMEDGVPIDEALGLWKQVAEEQRRKQPEKPAA